MKANLKHTGRGDLICVELIPEGELERIVLSVTARDWRNTAASYVTGRNDGGLEKYILHARTKGNEEEPAYPGFKLAEGLVEVDGKDSVKIGDADLVKELKEFDGCRGILVFDFVKREPESIANGSG